MIGYKQDIQVDKLFISEPKKYGERWVMDLSYCEQPMSFQPPTLRLNKELKQLCFNSYKKHDFLNFIDRLEKVIIEYIGSNCERLFKGKIFSEEKLKDSLKTSWDVGDDGVVSIDYEKYITDSTVFLSVFEEDINHESLTNNVVCVFVLDSIVFSKNNFELKYFISHLKSKKVDNSVNFFDNQESVIQDDTLEFFNE